MKDEAALDRAPQKQPFLQAGVASWQSVICVIADREAAV